MSKQLFIYLSNATAEGIDYCHNLNGYWVKNNDVAELAELCKHFSQIVAVVPGTEVLSLELNVPKLNRSKMYQAVRFLLEEHLVEDIALQHICLGEYDQEQQIIPLCVVKKSLLEAWLQHLRQYGITLTHMIADFYLVPALPGKINAVVHQNSLIARYTANLGAEIELENAEYYLMAALVNNVSLQAAIIQHLPHEVPNVNLPVPIENKRMQQDWFLSQAGYLDPAAINLLQHEFSYQKYNHRDWLSQAKRYKYLAIVMLLIVILNPLVSSLILTRQSQQLSTAIGQEYRYFFPASKIVIAPRQRIERLLKEGGANVADSFLLKVLQALATAKNNELSVAITKLQYAGNKIKLNISSADAQQINELSSMLMHQGFNVKQQDVDVQPTQVNAVIEVRQ